MRNIRKKEGITLVALVVTIIVLLILAGISLNLIAGSSGILERTSRAVKQYEMSAIAEEIELKLAELQIDYYNQVYVEQDPSAPATFGAYVDQQLQAGPIPTAEGQLVSAGGNQVIYQDLAGNDITTGTLNVVTGSITIAGVTTGGTTVTPTPSATLVSQIQPSDYGTPVDYSVTVPGSAVAKQTEKSRMVYEQKNILGLAERNGNQRAVAGMSKKYQTEATNTVLDNWKLLYSDSTGVYIIYGDYLPYELYPNALKEICGKLWRWWQFLL